MKNPANNEEKSLIFDDFLYCVGGFGFPSNIFSHDLFSLARSRIGIEVFDDFLEINEVQGNQC